MAIIEELGLEVKVTVNGSAVAEYKDGDPDAGDNALSPTTKTSRHYVESADNTEFEINVGLIPGANIAQEWINRSPSNAIRFSVAFDGGHDVARASVSQRTGKKLLDGIYNSANATLRKFCFAPVSTVEDADNARVAKDIKSAQNLGLIRVLVHRVVFKKTDKKIDKKADRKTNKNQSSPHRDEDITTGGISIAEKALKGKAVSHGLALSSPVAVERYPATAPVYDIEFVDTHASPFAAFYLKYRSKEALQQEMIIPRSESPSIESNLETLSPDEIRNLARERLLEMKSGKKRAVSVKDEGVRVPKSFKYVRTEDGRKAIDLTGDDSE